MTEAEILAHKWTYSVSEHQMTGGQVRMASIESENSVSFDFPYQGKQKGLLTLRLHPSEGVDALFQIERGQILCNSLSDCQVLARFDDFPAMSWTANEPRDNSSNLLFVDNSSEFARQLRSARIVRLQLTFYKEGAHVFEFQVGGFDFYKWSGQVPPPPASPTPNSPSPPSFEHRTSESDRQAMLDSLRSISQGGPTPKRNPDQERPAPAQIRKEPFGSSTNAQITEKTDSWHRLSYTSELWSTGQDLAVDFDVLVVNAQGVAVEQKTHRRIWLPASGKKVVITDSVEVRCPACSEVSGVQTQIRLR